MAEISDLEARRTAETAQLEKLAADLVGFERQTQEARRDLDNVLEKQNALDPQRFQLCPQFVERALRPRDIQCLIGGNSRVFQRTTERAGLTRLKWHPQRGAARGNGAIGSGAVSA